MQELIFLSIIRNIKLQKKIEILRISTKSSFVGQIYKLTRTSFLKLIPQTARNFFFDEIVKNGNALFKIKIKKENEQPKEYDISLILRLSVLI